MRIARIATPDGPRHQVTSWSPQAVVRGALPLRTEPPLATRVGEVPEWVAAALLLLIMVGSFVRHSDRGNGRGETAAAAGTKDEDDEDAA